MWIIAAAPCVLWGKQAVMSFTTCILVVGSAVLYGITAPFFVLLYLLLRVEDGRWKMEAHILIPRSEVQGHNAVSDERMTRPNKYTLNLGC